MIARIAWKNIWRNRLRSLVVIISIVLGLWAGTFVLAYVFGIMDQRLDDAIGYEISHLQIHHPDFLTDYDPRFTIAQSDSIQSVISADPRVAAVSSRMVAFGMAASPTVNSGGKFIGVDPKDEHAVTQIADLVTDGEFLSDSDKNKVIVGKKLANKLKIKIRSKIVLTLQDHERNIVAGAFRVKGIFSSYNTTLEENNLYVNRHDLDGLMMNNGQAHEIAILLNQRGEVDPTLEKLMSNYPSLSVRSWREVSPELGLMIDSIDQSMIIFLIIILLALSFGIINTMLMAVLERVREIGVLMAIGMNKLRLFAMIFLETFFIVGIATPIGLLCGYFTISYLGVAGLDLSGLYQEGYAAYGFQTMIYPHLEGIYYIRILILVAITALVSSIFPAVSALRLNPVTAIKKI